MGGIQRAREQIGLHGTHHLELSLLLLFFAQDTLHCVLGASPHLWVHITIISYLESTSWIFFILPPHPKAGACWNNNRFVCMQKVSWIRICQAFEQPWFSDSRNSMFNTHPNDPNKWLSWRFAYVCYRDMLFYITVHPNHISCGENSYLSLPFACVGWNSYLSLSCSRLCHTSKGHHVAHDLGSQHTTLNAKKGRHV
jgi:hypothetical protein